MMSESRRLRIHVNGIVQGVGFRPFVYRLAHECHLTGFVNNSSEGVLIEAEGRPADVAAFLARLREEAPPLSRIVSVETEELPANGDTAFVIRASQKEAPPITLVPPDMAICDDCLRELFDPKDRRYRYPFINCTNCGPRYTIVEGIPYDRPRTSMRVFPMCPDCEREYHDPANRRFHAQPNACPVCGPRVWLVDRNGKEIAAEDAIERAVELLRQGRILAIRGMGGFHLAVDAHNEAAIQELRRRKGRAEKPFALMAADLAVIKRYCHVSPEEETVLRSQIRPIVLLRAREDAGLPGAIAPKNRYLGFMLPYTPLHYLILRDNFDALIMTSGNYSEEPIAIKNEEALHRLRDLADAFLLHNREILQRCDDSVVRVMAGQPRVLRRARGYVPVPVFLARPCSRRILACGGELKNTVALSRGDAVFLSQHIGDLDNPEALDFFEASIRHLERILEITPEAIAHDLHPEYLSTKWALQQTGLPRVAVQHHHAHLAAVMAENGVDRPTIGIILDGTGYGTDGTIWGGEVLIGDFSGFRRYAHLEPFPLPGGTAAIKQPWRTALAVLQKAFGDEAYGLVLPGLEKSRGEIKLVLQAAEKGINAPLTSSCGRLFDAVSAMLGICHRISYEAQAAIELEMQVDEAETAVYGDALENVGGKGALPVGPLVRAVWQDVQQRTEPGKIAARFHWTLAELFLRAALRAREETGISTVGLSGGVFQNVQFFHYLLRRLQEENFEVLTHREVPTNDGGIALGQTVIADAGLGSDGRAAIWNWTPVRSETDGGESARIRSGF